jgi:S-adenosylmethionine:tRNA ribosyltransferase-isomerase
MKRSELIFERPEGLSARMPAEARGIARDSARLMVSTPDGHQHAQFLDLANYLQPGDLLVVNNSATLPASLPARGEIGEFIVNAAIDFGHNLWLVEPRWSSAQPGPLPLKAGDKIEVGGIATQLASTFPGLPRLWFARFDRDPRGAMAKLGKPIRYGYVKEEYPLSVYQTVFASVPGSAEMPSAAYPFTERVLARLANRGVQVAEITLHTGVSSLEVETEVVEDHPMYPEPFHVPAETAAAVNAARQEGRRVIAVGTTVVRSLESAWDGHEVRASRGYTRLYIHPARGVHTVDGLITGMHDPVTSHLAMLYAIAGQELIRTGYEEAVKAGYLWHEFGHSQLILPERKAVSGQRSAVSYQIPLLSYA